MIFSTRTALQLLVALSAVVAAPTHHDGDMLSARELSNLNNPEARSVMLGHQEYSRGYEDGLSVLVVRAPPGPKGTCKASMSGGKKLKSRALSEEDKANLKRQKEVHVKGLAEAKASYNSYKSKAASETNPTEKKKLERNRDSALQMMQYEQEEIASCDELLNG